MVDQTIGHQVCIPDTIDTLCSTKYLTFMEEITWYVKIDHIRRTTSLFIIMLRMMGSPEEKMTSHSVKCIMNVGPF